MTVLRHHVNPGNVYRTLDAGWSQAVVTEGGRTVRCAGVAAVDERGDVVGDDLAAQLDAVLENVRRVLVASGGTPADVVRVRVHLVDEDADASATVARALRGFFPTERLPAASLLSVRALADPRLLVELEVTAVLAAG